MQHASGMDQGTQFQGGGSLITRNARDAPSF
jgi:hypothetical protein